MIFLEPKDSKIRITMKNGGYYTFELNKKLQPHRMGDTIDSRMSENENEICDQLSREYIMRENFKLRKMKVGLVSVAITMLYIMTNGQAEASGT